MQSGGSTPMRNPKVECDCGQPWRGHPNTHAVTCQTQAAYWIATKNGEIIASAGSSKALFLRLAEPDLADVRGIIVERHR